LNQPPDGQLFAELEIRMQQQLKPIYSIFTTRNLNNRAPTIWASNPFANHQHNNFAAPRIIF